MPYQSEAQMRYMHAKHPKIAKRWDKKYGSNPTNTEKAKRALKSY